MLIDIKYIPYLDVFLQCNRFKNRPALISTMAASPDAETENGHAKTIQGSEPSVTTSAFSLDTNTIGVPESGWRVHLNHEFPEKWGPLGLTIRFNQALHFIRSGIR